MEAFKSKRSTKSALHAKYDIRESQVFNALIYEVVIFRDW